MLNGQIKSAFVGAILLASVGMPAFAGGGEGADGLRGLISLRYPGLEWVTREDLSQWMNEGSAPKVVLLDSRPAEEFAVSHLFGARRVDPDVPAESLNDLPRDARVVVYCSVGYRSAVVARRLLEAGFDSAYNLEGGIFGWANEGRAVYQGSDPVGRVHPYNRIWGKLLDEKYHPEN